MYSRRKLFFILNPSTVYPCDSPLFSTKCEFYYCPQFKMNCEDIIHFNLLPLPGFMSLVVFLLRDVELDRDRYQKTDGETEFGCPRDIAHTWYVQQ